MKKLISAILIICMTALTLSGCGKSTQAQTTARPTTPVTGKRIACIVKTSHAQCDQTWIDQVQATAESFGMQFEPHYCDDNAQTFDDTVSSCAASGCDGMLLVGGTQDGLHRTLSDLKKQYPKLSLVLYDTELTDANTDEAGLDGILQIFSGAAPAADAVAQYLSQTLFTDKAPVNIMQVNLGDHTSSRFQAALAGWETQGAVHTVVSVGPTDETNITASVQQAVTQELADLPEGSIDAIVVSNPAYTQGVYTALSEGGYDIPVVFLGASDKDLENMAADGSCLQACAISDAARNGEFAMRALALELTGEQTAIHDPATGSSSNSILLPNSLLTQQALKGKTLTQQQLKDVADETYSDRSILPTTSWIEACGEE